MVDMLVNIMNNHLQIVFSCCHEAKLFDANVGYVEEGGEVKPTDYYCKVFQLGQILFLHLDRHGRLQKVASRVAYI